MAPCPGIPSGIWLIGPRGALFCGDTLFGAGCGLLFEGSPAQMADSPDRIAALPASMRIYCAHEYTEMNSRFALAVEPDNVALQARVAQVASLRAAGLPSVPSSLGEEKATNPFLRCSEPAVIEAALLRCGRARPGFGLCGHTAGETVFRAFSAGCGCGPWPACPVPGLR